jgi:hypothetical protein
LLGGRANITAATTDIRFTILPVSNALGQPVLCVVIFQTEQPNIPCNWISRIDLFAPVTDDADSMTWLRNNSGGPGKQMPYGPCCKVGDVEVPAMITGTPHGGITGQLLSDFLAYLHKLDFFPRDKGPQLMLILDGHNSRFSLPFLRYINDPLKKWTVCIGTPYATDEWQFGDAPEMNGGFSPR